MGTLLSVCQVVNASDSVAHRIYIQKDVRLLQHCSVEVLRHLKTLNETIFKGMNSILVKRNIRRKKIFNIK